MSNIVLDYSDYYEDKYEYSRNGRNGNIHEKPYKDPNDINKFFKKRGYCPFCGKNMPIVFKNKRSNTIGEELWEFITIWECNTCGWWEYSYKFSEELDLGDEVSTKNWDTLRHGIVKKFNISDKQIPIDTLMSEIVKNQSVLYDINPYKLEDIAKVVFSAYYNCEVKHVGKTGDGGTDLIIVQSDDPILVQVKCRENPEHIELVKGIREFVGTMYIEDAHKGIYLSTAKEFSRGCKKTSEQLLSNRKFDTFDLVNYEKFCSMLGVIKKDSLKPWMKFVENIKKE